MRRFLFDEYGLRPPAFILGAMTIVASIVVGVRISDRHDFNTRFTQCMADKHDTYFCDLWASHHTPPMRCP